MPLLNIVKSTDQMYKTSIVPKQPSPQTFLSKFMAKMTTKEVKTKETQIKPINDHEIRKLVLEEYKSRKCK